MCVHIKGSGRAKAHTCSCSRELRAPAAAMAAPGLLAAVTAASTRLSSSAAIAGDALAGQD